MVHGFVLALLFSTAFPSAPSLGLTTEEQKTIDVYRKAAQSVVHIRSVVVRYGFLFQPFPQQGMGSGVIMDDYGHIVTNSHVVRRAESIEVTLWDGSQWPAQLVGDLPEQDLAVIRIEAPSEALRPISLGNSKDLKVGQTVLAIGNPFGFQLTLTKGVISSLNRTLVADGRRLQGLIQTDAAINPGNSGGPLLNREGELIGINTIIVSPSGGSARVGFAIPIETVERCLPKLAKGKGSTFVNALMALIGVGILVWLWAKRWRLGPRW
ncbi:MAG: S1C family serine protease [Thermodesulfobacteriota bacterium]